MSSYVYKTPGWTPIRSEDIPSSLEEFFEWAEEFFTGDNFEKLCQEAKERERKKREPEPWIKKIEVQ